MFLVLVLTHLATFKPIDAVEIVTGSSVDSRQIVTVCALAESFFVKRPPYILVITMPVVIIWMCVWFTASSRLDVRYVMAMAPVKFSDKVTSSTSSPPVVAIKKKIRKRTVLHNNVNIRCPDSVVLSSSVDNVSKRVACLANKDYIGKGEGVALNRV